MIDEIQVLAPRDRSVGLPQTLRRSCSTRSSSRRCAAAAAWRCAASPPRRRRRASRGCWTDSRSSATCRDTGTARTAAHRRTATQRADPLPSQVLRQRGGGGAGRGVVHAQRDGGGDGRRRPLHVPRRQRAGRRRALRETQHLR